jgi:hypothetical protein
MTRPSIPILALIVVVGVLSVGLAQVRPGAGKPAAKKLIEWGWDEPDPAFMRAHAAAMDELPFDGLVFHANSDPGGRLTWEAWGGRDFAADQFRKALDDLSATRFRRLTDRFLRVNVTPGTVDWFDDRAWATVAGNFGVAAHIAKAGGCKGLMFDVEQYEGRPFDYARQAHRGERSFAEYQAKVRQRGREWVRAVNAQFDDVTILLTFGYQIAQPGTGKDRSAADYGLLANFLDGVLEAATDATTVVDAWEAAYPYKEARQFEQAYKTTRETALGWTAVPGRYRDRMRVGFGIWLDYEWRTRGWDVGDPARNYFTPAAFEAAVRAALRISDGYVWVYSEQPRWWTREKLPPAYVDALRRARATAE